MIPLGINVKAAEPKLDVILDGLGFTHIDLTSIETFPAGKYNITLYAEYAGHHDENNLTWYKVGTSDFDLIFDGPEGVPSGSPGLVDPPLTKSFTSDSEFGLSLGSPDGIWYTETNKNPDGKRKHAEVYQNLDDPNMFLIGFENLYAGGDADFNDMVVSLKFLPPPPAVGGVWVPINKFTLLAPWISLASALTSGVAVSIYIDAKRRRKKLKRK